MTISLGPGHQTGTNRTVTQRWNGRVGHHDGHGRSGRSCCRPGEHVLVPSTRNCVLRLDTAHFFPLVRRAPDKVLKGGQRSEARPRCQMIGLGGISRRIPRHVYIGSLNQTIRHGSNARTPSIAIRPAGREGRLFLSLSVIPSLPTPESDGPAGTCALPAQCSWVGVYGCMYGCSSKNVPGRWEYRVHSYSSLPEARR